MYFKYETVHSLKRLIYLFTLTITIVVNDRHCLDDSWTFTHTVKFLYSNVSFEEFRFTGSVIMLLVYTSMKLWYQTKRRQ